ncbi:TadE family protein [Novosphingobium sp.]|uniref:TadE family protein n=1 Tax=Novosphingobium sp. TaxID=1874826 RepID=UPI0025D11A48|nr:TadE family protein [Novosphingobium sp.]
MEFALLAPVLLISLLGIFDMAYTMYAQTLLQGALQQAARNSTIEGAAGSTATIDAAVTSSVRTAIIDATVTFKRKSYASFSKVGVAEQFTDTNSNGTCDAGEPFEDVNNNGGWDRDQGSIGLGGARDAVLYTATMTFPRAFPIAGFINIPTNVTVNGSTVLRNQPYGLQQSSPPTVRYCP